MNLHVNHEEMGLDPINRLNLVTHLLHVQSQDGFPTLYIVIFFLCAMI